MRGVARSGRGPAMAAGAAVALTLAAACSSAHPASHPVPSPSNAPATSGSPTPSPRRTLPLAGRTIVIDPGHNGGNGANPALINQLVPAGGFDKPCDTTGTETDG